MRPGSSHRLADGTWLRLSPAATPEEVAAVVLAVQRRRADTRRAPSASRMPTWLRAGRREAMGGRPVHSPTDL